MPLFPNFDDVESDIDMMLDRNTTSLEETLGDMSANNRIPGDTSSSSSEGEDGEEADGVDLRDQFDELPGKNSSIGASETSSTYRSGPYRLSHYFADTNLPDNYSPASSLCTPPEARSSPVHTADETPLRIPRRDARRLLDTTSSDSVVSFALT